MTRTIGQTNTELHEAILTLWESTYQFQRRFRGTTLIETGPAIYMVQEEYAEVREAACFGEPAEVAEESADLIVTSFGYSMSRGLIFDDIKDALFNVSVVHYEELSEALDALDYWVKQISQSAISSIEQTVRYQERLFGNVLSVALARGVTVHAVCEAMRKVAQKNDAKTIVTHYLDAATGKITRREKKNA